MFKQGIVRPSEGESEDDHDVDVPFVGRHKTRDLVKTQITNHDRRLRLVQICGPAMVGKSRFAKQISQELNQEARDKEIGDFVTGFISVRDLDSLETIKLKLCTLFNLDEISSTNFTTLLENHFTRDNTTDYLVVLDNCESMSTNQDLQNEFMQLVYQLINVSRNITIVTTSRQQLTFTRIHANKQTLIDLKPLDVNDSQELLRIVTPNVLWDEVTCLRVCKSCHYFPYTIIFVGHILNLRDYEPQEVIQVLNQQSFGGLENESQHSHDQPFTVLMEVLAPLSSFLINVARKYAYFPQNFDAQAAAHIGGFGDVIEAKSKALIPLKHKSLLQFDSENMRFEMHSVYREFINITEPESITEITETRHRFAEWFGEMTINVNKRLEKNPPNKVLRELTEDWPNIEHLMREALHCNASETYGVYMKIARKAEHFLAKYMPQNSVTFFRGMLDYAEKIGNEEDVAILLANLGNAMSNTTYIPKKTSLKYMKRAYRMMVAQGKSTYQMKRLLCNMAWLYFQAGKIDKGLRLQHQATNMLIHDINETEDKRNINLDLKLSSHMAMSQNSHLRFKESNEILERSIAKARDVSEFSPVIAVMLNTQGLNHEGLNGSVDALPYYLQSLHERQKYQGGASLVIPLNNVAKCLMRDCRYEECLKYLEDAEAKLKEAKEAGPNLVVTKRQMGQCYYKMGEYQTAIRHYKEAYAIEEAFAERHYDLPELRLEIVHCYKAMGDRQNAAVICREIVDDNKDYYMDKSASGYEVLKTISRLYKDLDDEKTNDEIIQRKIEGKFRLYAAKCRNDGQPLRAILLETWAQEIQTARVNDMKSEISSKSVNKGKRVTFDTPRKDAGIKQTASNDTVLNLILGMNELKTKDDDSSGDEVLKLLEQQEKTQIGASKIQFNSQGKPYRDGENGDKALDMVLESSQVASKGDKGNDDVMATNIDHDRGNRQLKHAGGFLASGPYVNYPITNEQNAVGGSGYQIRKENSGRYSRTAGDNLGNIVDNQAKAETKEHYVNVNNQHTDMSRQNYAALVTSNSQVSSNVAIDRKSLSKDIQPPAYPPRKHDLHHNIDEGLTENQAGGFLNLRIDGNEIPTRSEVGNYPSTIDNLSNETHPPTRPWKRPLDSLPCESYDDSYDERTIKRN